MVLKVIKIQGQPGPAVPSGCTCPYIISRQNIKAGAGGAGVSASERQPEHS
jgi:hypothetical protein